MFKAGQSGNPQGRKPGQRNRKTLRAMEQTAKLLADLEKQVPISNGKNIDPLVLLTAILSDPKIDTALRIQACAITLPYRHNRMTARYISRPVELSACATVEQATASIAKIGALAAAGKLALDEANDLVGYQKAFIEARATTEIEQRLAAIEEVLRHQQFRPLELNVVGGMPDLPGANVSMPQRTLAAPVAADPDPSDGDGPPQ